LILRCVLSWLTAAPRRSSDCCGWRRATSSTCQGQGSFFQRSEDQSVDQGDI